MNNDNFKGLLNSELIQEGELTHKVDRDSAIYLGVIVFAAMFLAVTMGIVIGRRL